MMTEQTVNQIKHWLNTHLWLTRKLGITQVYELYKQDNPNDTTTTAGDFVSVYMSAIKYE